MIAYWITVKILTPCFESSLLFYYVTKNVITGVQPISILQSQIENLLIFSPLISC